jgi:hypothetical protein
MPEYRALTLSVSIGLSSVGSMARQLVRPEIVLGR